MRRSAALVMLVSLALAACTEEQRASGSSGDRPESPELAVLSFEQRGATDVRRDEPLVIRFSEPLDPESVAQGSVRVLRRRGNRDQPVRFEVRGDRLLLHPPSPFGFEPNARYWLSIEGFPSLRAPRSASGRPLARRYRAWFVTSDLYRPENVAPTVTSLRIEEEPGGGWSLSLEFSETLELGSLEPGVTFHVLSADTGETVPGRLLSDRRSREFRYLPRPGVRPSAIHVLLTAGIRDLAGNALADPSDVLLPLPAAAGESDPLPRRGEITEDFTTRSMMDPRGTTALWNDPAEPGALLGSPARTTLFLPGDESLPEEWIRIGDEELRIRLLLLREEIGAPRELTGLFWSPPETGHDRATYEHLSVRITPTDRRRLREIPEMGEPPTVVLEQPQYRVEAGFEAEMPVPFERPFTWDGRSNLLLEIRIGRGDHTNFLRVRPARRGEASLRVGRRVRPLRPVIGLTGFSLYPVATSFFYDTGADEPEYFSAVLHPRRQPRGAEMTVLFQGASRLDPEGRIPADDPTAASPWVKEPALLSGYRYLRFRILFEGGSLTGEEPLVDDIVIPFRR